MKTPLTVAILHHRSFLPQTIKSCLFAAEILIVHDQNSLFPPPKIKSEKIKIFTRPLNNFASQRNFALKQAKNTWVLFLDSDEIIPVSLAEEIKIAIKSNKNNGCYLHRQDIFYHQKLHFGESGKIKLLRLGKKTAGTWSRHVHETWQLNGQLGELQSPLLHYRSNLTAGFINRFVLYSPLDAAELTSEGKPFSYPRLLLYPLAKFILNYFL